MSIRICFTYEFNQRPSIRPVSFVFYPPAVVNGLISKKNKETADFVIIFIERCWFIIFKAEYPASTGGGSFIILTYEEKMEKEKTVKARVLVRKVSFGYADIEIPAEAAAGAKDTSSFIADYARENCAFVNYDVIWTNNTGVTISGGYILKDTDG